VNSTADAVVALRAAGTREPDVRNEDVLARRFVLLRPGLAALARLPCSHLLARTIAERIVPGCYYYELARTRCLDAWVTDELQRGLARLVVLGAGYDSRAYRLPLAGTRVLELDLPQLLARKRRRIERIFGALPAHVAYGTVDLERQEPSLNGRGRTLVLWSGVSMYLSDPAVERVLRAVARLAPGSVLLFDYAYDGDDWPGLPEFRRYVARRDEPLRWRLPPGTLRTHLATRGLTLACELDPDQLADRWLRRRDGTLLGRPYSFIALARAVVPEPDET
jgi:methyltransferase (TIGR00027 family)